MITITNVSVRRAEGPSELCGTWIHFRSLHEANSYLSLHSHSYAKQGYDKTDFQIDFSDPEFQYNGRLDTQHPENKYYSPSSNNIYLHVCEWLKWVMKEHTNIPESVKEATEMLTVITAAYEHEEGLLKRN